MTVEQAIEQGWTITPAPSLLWRIAREARAVIRAGASGYSTEPSTLNDINETESRHRKIGAEFRRRLAEARIYVEGDTL